RPHLSVVRLLKNCAAGFAVRVAALSAAEKRDYAEPFASRQQVYQHFLLRRQHRSAFASLPTPPPFGCEGANIKGAGAQRQANLSRNPNPPLKCAISDKCHTGDSIAGTLGLSWRPIPIRSTP
ncbi:hypothetical protein, partial [Cupriavidus gilardii]